MTLGPISCRVALAAAGLAVLFVAGCAPGGNTSSSQTSGNSTGINGQEQGEATTYTIDQQVRTIALNARSGKVRVTAKDGPISVTERPRYTGGRPVTSHDVTGDTLNLREEGCPDRPVNGQCQVAWDITAPAATVLNLQTNAGGIELTGMAADVTARTDAGGVEGRQLTSRRVTASSDAGGIELDFTQPPDQIDAENEAGGVEITVPAGPSYAVDTGDTRKPEIEVPQDSASPHKIRARNNAGGVEIKRG